MSVRDEAMMSRRAATNAGRLESAPVEHGFIYMQRWNAPLRAPDPRGFLNEDECRDRWARHRSDRIDWFTVIPAEDGVGTFLRRADGGFDLDKSSAAPSWSMEVTPRGGIAADGPGFQVFLWDRHNRNVTTGTFSNRWGGRLFLSELIIRVFSDPAEFREKEKHLTNEAVFTDVLSFQPSGLAQVSRSDHHRKTREVEQFSDVDIDANWFDVPSFADWSTLVRPLQDGAFFL